MKMKQIEALIEAVRNMENCGPCLIGNGDRNYLTVQENAANDATSAAFSAQVKLCKQAIQAELAKKGKSYNPYAKALAEGKA